MNTLEVILPDLKPLAEEGRKNLKNWDSYIETEADKKVYERKPLVSIADQIQQQIEEEEDNSESSSDSVSERDSVALEEKKADIGAEKEVKKEASPKNGVEEESKAD